MKTPEYTVEELTQIEDLTNEAGKLAYAAMYAKALTPQQIHQMMESPLEMMTKQKNPKMMLGTVLVFKEGTTQQQVVQILKALHPVLESDAGVNVFDAQYGSGPVWYIP